MSEDAPLPPSRNGFVKKRKGAARYDDPRVFVLRQLFSATATPEQGLLLCWFMYWFSLPQSRVNRLGELHEDQGSHDLTGEWRSSLTPHQTTHQFALNAHSSGGDRRVRRTRAKLWVPGQEVFGIGSTYATIGEELGLSRGQVRRAAVQLQACGYITIGQTPSGIVVTPQDNLGVFISALQDNQIAGSSLPGVLLYRSTTLACKSRIPAALLLQQLMWYAATPKDREGNFHRRSRALIYRKDREFAEELGLSKPQVQRARKHLLDQGFIQTEVKWAGPASSRLHAVHYYLVNARLNEALRESSAPNTP